MHITPNNIIHTIYTRRSFCRGAEYGTSKHCTRKQKNAQPTTAHSNTNNNNGNGHGKNYNNTTHKKKQNQKRQRQPEKKRDSKWQNKECITPKQKHKMPNAINSAAHTGMYRCLSAPRSLCLSVSFSDCCISSFAHHQVWPLSIPVLYDNQFNHSADFSSNKSIWQWFIAINNNSRATATQRCPYSVYLHRVSI